MKQVFSFGGKIVVEEVPAPACGDNEVIVQSMFSVISAGTEGSSLKQSAKGVTGLVAKAKDNPELVQKALDMARREGISKTLDTVRGQIKGNLSPLGYSSSGVVLETGKNITDISVGDRVACAGAGYANHAEVVAVPRNLVSKIPEGVEFNQAAFTTLGAITLQAVRRARVQLGDRVVVMGLGLLGQIACQILNSSGAHVIGIDPIKERVELAEELGAERCFISRKDVVSQVLKHTDETGADSVIICAATPSSEPVSQAMQMSREKGKVVVVGAVGMELERSPFYEKELDFLISSSYGPGRYDPSYEEKGIDYPIGYVRWTENRNMQEFLSLLAAGKVNVERLIDIVSPVDEADKAYKTLVSPGKRPLAVLFKYAAVPELAPLRVVELKAGEKVAGKINVAVIGAGSFAQAYHLPNLKRIPAYNVRAIITKTGSNAKSLAKKYRAQYCSTDYKEALNDNDVDMVLIATRHNLHAPLIVEAAGAGKHIFVEKPIALSYEECRAVYQAVTESKVNLTVGFNRRFSPLAQKAKRVIERRKSPLVITYRVNSAATKKEHWINDPEEGGGVIVGEGCHFFDFINWLIGAEPNRIYAGSISSNNPSLIDTSNMACTLSYSDGSVASLVYNTIGNEAFSKERIEVFVDGGVVTIDDFKELVITGLGDKGAKLSRAEKGQFELLREYGKFLNGQSQGLDLPTVQDGIRATICSLKALESLQAGEAQEIDSPGFLAIQ